MASISFYFLLCLGLIASEAITLHPPHVCLLALFCILLRPRHIFFLLFFVNQSDARFRETTLPHTFRPGRVSSPKSPPASALTHSWLLCLSINRRPPEWRRPIPPSFFLFSRSRPKRRATVLPTRSALVARPPRNPFQRRRQLLFDCCV